MEAPTHKLSFWALTALVVGSMIGAGIFSLPATFGRATGVLGAAIAWAIAGGGMLMLAFVFQTLAQRKPDLDAGVFAYAHAGFGSYTGFISALGFWAGCCVANASFFILIKSTLGGVFPLFGDGNTVPAVAAASVLLWAFHFLVMRGVKGAATINTIATIAKLIPLGLFLMTLVWAFQADVFWGNFWGDTATALGSVDFTHLEEYGFVGHAAEIMETGKADSLFTQVRSTMLVTVFVFVGIEGASVYSRYARNREDVGAATVVGFLGVLCLLVLVTLLSYGVLGRDALAALRQPSMSGVMASVVGPFGAVFISVGLLISVLGAYLSWTLLAAEALFAAAVNGSMPRFLTRENTAKVPVAALWLTNTLVQIFLILTLFTDSAFSLALELTSALCLIPYLLVGAYGVKLAWTGETYEPGTRAQRKDLIIAVAATVYACLMLYSGGVKYLLLSALIYAPGSLLFIRARREQKVRMFTAPERYGFFLLFGGAIVAVYSLFAGIIHL